MNTYTITDIKDIIQKFLYPKLRLICICDNFIVGEHDEFAFIKCVNCGGWKSYERMVNRV
jgi:hypothetical protein